MISLLIAIAVVAILLAAAWALSAHLPGPYGAILQIVVGAIGAIYILMLLARFVGADVPSLR